jgi:hypothetical protein
MSDMTPEKAQALLDEKWFYGDEHAEDLARAYIAQAARIADLEKALHDAICENVSTIKRLAEVERQLAEALEEAAVAGGQAAVEVLLRQEPDASPLKTQMTRQAIAKAIRNLKGPTPEKGKAIRADIDEAAMRSLTGDYP